MDIAELDSIIKESLEGFCREVLPSPWHGREHEMVSLFLLGHLARHCSPHGPLHLTQVGIDVGVKQLEERKPGNVMGPTKDVQKDLVIWSEPAGTLWNSDGQIANEPLLVMEWKVIYRNHKKAALADHDYDKHWLEETARRIGANFLGYAVLVNMCQPRTLTCAKVAMPECKAKEWFPGKG
jgi:hypothetical protein